MFERKMSPLHRLGHLSTGLLLSGTVWGSLGSTMVLWEEMCHWGQDKGSYHLGFTFS